MICLNTTDARVARVLAEVEPFCRWQNRPLPRQMRQMVQELDDQALMSLAALAIRQVMERCRELPAARA